MRRMILGLLFFAVLAWLAYLWSRHSVTQVPPRTSVDTLAVGMKTMRLYFAAPNADSLIAEAREIPPPSGAHALAAALVAELDRGPREGGVAVLPAGTSVLNVYVDGHGLLTIDLSRAFLQSFRGGSSAEYLAIASLVRTLGANMPDVQRVQIVCGGAPLVTLGGHMPLDRPLEVAEWSGGRTL
jgi:Sporulation and spore germination